MQGIKIAPLMGSLALTVLTAYGEPPLTQQRPGDRRPATKLQVGDPAPDFTLTSPDKKRTVTLSRYRGQKPVALVFGSYT